MNLIIKKAFLLGIAVILGYFTATYFGIAYTKFFGSGGAWIGSESSWDFIIGFPLSLMFFVTTVSCILIFRNKKNTLWLISPLILWEIIVDVRHLYLSVALILVAYGLALLLRKAFRLPVNQ